MSLAQSAKGSPVSVSLTSSICVPGRSEVLVNCHVPKNSREQLGMISPLSENPDLSDSISEHIQSVKKCFCSSNEYI